MGAVWKVIGMSAAVIAAHAVSSIAIAFGAIAAKASSSLTTVAIAYPASPGAGDLAIAFRNGFNASQVTFSDEAGWTNRGDRTGGTNTIQDAHSAHIRTDTKELAGGESGSVTFDMAANSGAMIGLMLRYTKAGGTWDVAYTDGDDNTHGANRSVTGGASLSFQPGDKIVALVATDTDTGLTITSPVFTASGITFGTPVERTTAVEGGTGLGNDGNIQIFDADITAGSGTAAPTFAFTTATSQCGPIAFLRLRAA